MAEAFETQQSGDDEAVALEALGLGRAESPGVESIRVRSPIGERALVGLLFVGLVTIRLIALDQPIVENYVGRQIPTAMVARELERGANFLRPQLQTGPFPNYFLVEPPIYQAHLLAVRRIVKLPIDQAGRVISALASGIACLCLYLVVRRQRDARTGLVAMFVLGLLPVLLRYGRGVQPDVLAMAYVLLGFVGWQKWARGGGRMAALCGWMFLAVGLAAKVLWIFVLLPLAVMLYPSVRHGRSVIAAIGLLVAILASELLPAGAWYVSAANLLRQGAAPSHLSAWAWAAAIWPPGLLRFETWDWLTRFGVIRAFSPLALLLALRAMYLDVVDRMWTAWFVAGLALLLTISGKLHHEYYWLLLAPAVVVCVASQVARFWEQAEIEGRAPVEALALLALQTALVFVLAWSTWSTPSEWRNIREAGARIAESVPSDQMLIAREAVLFYADRRGYRLETEQESAARALAELGESDGSADTGDSLKRLIRVYRDRGASYLAETGPAEGARVSPRLSDVLDSLGARVVVADGGLLVVRMR